VTRVVLALGAVGLVVALVIALGSKHRVWLGTNDVEWAQFVVFVDAGHRVCQRSGELPEGLGAVRMRIGTYDHPGPPTDIVLRAGGRDVSRGTLAPGWQGGDVDVALSPLRHPVDDARLCIVNRGRTRLAVAGEDRGQGRARHQRAGLIFFGATARPWWDRIGLLGRRFAEARSQWYGRASLVVALVLVALAAAAAFAVAWARLR